MRQISLIQISGLFGLYNHNIPLNMEEKITIIHGPNGIGKTVAINMIDSLFKLELDLFFRIPFESFKVHFDDGSFISINQIQYEGYRSQLNTDINKTTAIQPEILCAFQIPAKKIAHFYIALEKPEDDLQDFGQFIENVTTKLRISFKPSRRAFEYRKKEYYLYEFLEEFGEQLTPTEKRILIYYMSFIPDDFKDLIRSTRIRFISTQRLFIQPAKTQEKPGTENASDDSQDRRVSAIAVFSKELSEIMAQKNNEYATLSQTLDSTFPNRVISQVTTGISDRTYEELRMELLSLDNKRKRLLNVGFLDKREEISLPEEILDQTRREYLTSVLSISLSDMQEKLKIFDELLVKIELMMQIINSRFSFKMFRVDRHKGFVIITDNGIELSPLNLSSGEQHEIVMVYEMLFRVEAGSLILIDEPEISLHIAWQEKFLNDLLSITKIANFQALVATHSPNIIQDRWDLTVDLVESRVVGESSSPTDRWGSSVEFMDSEHHDDLQDIDWKFLFGDEAGDTGQPSQMQQNDTDDEEDSLV